MVKESLLDIKVVYLHRSSISSGQNALLRRPKKIRELLEKHQADIGILTSQFTVAAIAVVASFLLEDRVFESLTRAKLRLPELFEQSSAPQETKEAGLDAAPEELLDSDDGEGVKLVDGSQPAEPKVRIKNEGRTQNSRKIEAPTPRSVNQLPSRRGNITDPQSSATPASTPKTLPIPDLNPLYLPFKTQHKILVHIQTSLEEYCFPFSNIHFPLQMQLYKWDVPESIELTQWTHKFAKLLNTLPSSAINRIPGRSVTDILIATNTIRHAAVHRQRVTAAEMLEMLDAAITFAHTLRDTARAKQIKKAKSQLTLSIYQVTWYQRLLARNFKPIFASIAHRRTELDELEASSIEEMVATEKQQRALVGDALERFFDAEGKAIEETAAAPVEVKNGKAEVSDAEEDEESDVGAEEGGILIAAFA